MAHGDGEISSPSFSFHSCARCETPTHRVAATTEQDISRGALASPLPSNTHLEQKRVPPAGAVIPETTNGVQKQLITFAGKPLLPQLFAIQPGLDAKTELRWLPQVRSQALAKGVRCEEAMNGRLPEPEGAAAFLTAQS